MPNQYTKTDNRDYFKTWNHNMAYILGFYTGDGCITKSENSLRLSFTIQERDRYILEFIRNNINPNRKVNDYQRIDKSGNLRTYSNLTISNREICESILSYGFMMRKSYNMRLPDVPNEYIRDYLRGYFDADGCVYKKTATFFCLDGEFLEKLKSTTVNLGKIIKKKTYRWYFSSIEDVINLREFMYNGNFCCIRKKERFDLAEYEKKKFLAFGEEKLISEWVRDTRCNVSQQTLHRRITKYKDILSPENIISLGIRGHNDHIFKFVFISPDDKIYKVGSLTDFDVNITYDQKRSILRDKKPISKNGWLARKATEDFNSWCERKKGIDECDLLRIKNLWN